MLNSDFGAQMLDSGSSKSDIGAQISESRSGDGFELRFWTSDHGFRGSDSDSESISG